MHHRLYFLDLLNRALDEGDALEVLPPAFQEIRRLGNTSRYAAGYHAYQQFMDIARTSGCPLVSLLLDGRELTAIPLLRTVQCVSLPGIEPGELEVVSGTGRLYWAGELSESDLLWSLAFPSSDLPAAARTGTFTSTHSREIEVLPGELSIRVCPGLTTGCLRVLITVDAYNENDKEDYWSRNDSPGL